MHEILLSLLLCIACSSGYSFKHNFLKNINKRIIVLKHKVHAFHCWSQSLVRSLENVSVTN